MLLLGLPPVIAEDIEPHLDAFETMRVENRDSIDETLDSLTEPTILVMDGDASAANDTDRYTALASACSRGLVHVVFLSNQGYIPLAYRLLPTGCFDSVRKPVDHVELQNVLETHAMILTYEHLSLPSTTRYSKPSSCRLHSGS